MLPVGLLASRLAPIGLVLLGAVVISGGTYLLGRSHGAGVCELAHKAELAESLQRGIEQAQDIARQDAEVSEFYERWRTRTVTKVEEVTREITPDCARCGVGDNGLRLINEARGYGPSASHPGQPDGTVPSAPPGGVGQAPGVGRPLVGNQSNVLRLRHETSLAHGVGEAQGGI